MGEGEETTLGALLPSEAPEPSEEVAIDHSRAALRRAVAGLPETERRVIELRYGLDDDQPVPLRAAARELGLFAAEVEWMERQALARLAMRRELAELREARNGVRAARCGSVVHG